MCMESVPSTVPVAQFVTSLHHSQITNFLLVCTHRLQTKKKILKNYRIKYLCKLKL